jgi:hypothetical protein
VFDNQEFIAWANENVVFLVGHEGKSHSAYEAKPGDKDAKDDKKDGKDEKKDAEKPEPETTKPEAAKPEGGDESAKAPAGGCSIYAGITCEEHEKVAADAKEGSGGPKLEFKGWPTSFMIAPDGTVEKHESDRAVKSLEDGVADFTKKKGLKPDKKFLTYLAALDEGDQATADGKWKVAITAYLKVDAVSKKMKGLGATLTPKVAALSDAIAAAFTKLKGDESKDAAAKFAAVKALRADVGARFAAGLLPVVADLDAWLKENPPPAPPKK